MTSPDLAHAAVWGITLKDVVTAIMIPIIATLTTLIVQDRQQAKERRTQILRMLLSTRHTPADPAFNAAINLIPVEFNRAKPVMAAWTAYIDAVRATPAPGEEAALQQRNTAKQAKLIGAIMKKLGLVHSEADIQTEAYLSNGFVWRDTLFLDSLKAQRDAANAMADVAKAIREQ